MLWRSKGMRKDVIWRLLSIILAIATALLITSVHSITDQQDALVLKSLYTSLNSPSQLTGWTAQGLDPCGDSWKGVTCVGPDVTELNLANLGLSGSFNYMLQQLTLLHTFDISGNAFSGEVPYLLPPNLQTLNMEKNSFSGALPYSIADMKNLTTMKLAHNQLSGAFIDVYSKLQKLNYLDLSFNQISGQLPQSFAKLQNLSTLYLQSNQLSGTLNILDSLSSLKDVNVENNQFSGWVPAILRRIPNAQFSGNYFSSSPAPPPPPFTPPPPRQSSPPPPQSSGTSPPPKSSSNTSSSTPNTNTNPSPNTKSNTNNSNNTTSDNSNSGSGLNKGFLGGIVALSAVAIVGGSITLIFCLKKEKRKTSSNGDAMRFSTASAMGPSFSPSNQVVKENSKPPESVMLKPPPVEWVKGEKGPGKKEARKKKGSPIVATAFSVAELQAATSSFSQDKLVGEGALGRVYRADMPSGKVLAVKKINALSSDTLENDQDFMEIVWNISRLRHSNVVELVGYCIEHRQRLLMYDFYPKGTLHDILHGADEDLKRELVWNIRVKIALGAARSLEYLHEVCMPSVVHKNFKSGNILLDDELNPHLADCGIAVFSPNLDAQGSNIGYNAPEHTMSGIYTEKSDVYSFGVAMLELLTGRKPLDSSRPRSEQSLVRWATPQLHDIDALDKMVDPLLNGLYPAKSLSRFADIIALCVQPEPEFRPPMSEVVQSLVRLMQRATISKRRAGDEHNGAENNSSYDAFM